MCIAKSLAVVLNHLPGFPNSIAIRAGITKPKRQKAPFRIKTGRVRFVIQAIGIMVVDPICTYDINSTRNFDICQSPPANGLRCYSHAIQIRCCVEDRGWQGG